MEYEKEGNYYAQWHVVEDLKKEKVRLLDEMYKGSIDGFYGLDDNQMTPDDVITATLRVEEITRILEAIRLGYYKEP